MIHRLHAFQPAHLSVLPPPLCWLPYAHTCYDSYRSRRAIFGSVERFFGILVENYAGDFPLWFAPEQIRLLAVNDDVVPYCEEVMSTLLSRQANRESGCLCVVPCLLCAVL